MQQGSSMQGCIVVAVGAAVAVAVAVDVVLGEVLWVCLLLIEVVEGGVPVCGVIIALCERSLAVQWRSSIHVVLAVEVVWCIGSRNM
jgi:hypothetical protein